MTNRDLSQSNPNQSNQSKLNLIWTVALLAVVLGPLAAFSLGQRYADEETLARAEAGDRNHDALDIYPDNAYGLPELIGTAAETTVHDITANAPLFEDYRRAVDDSGFGAVLEGPGPLTVFVPTDDAFVKLSDVQRRDIFGDREKLVQLLSNHVVRGQLSATDLLERDEVDAISGVTIPIEQGGTAIRFGNADIIKSNLVAGNGVVHVVDGLNL